MYSSEDLERFYFQYQTESLPKGESLQAFCLRSNVPYNIFHKWYKDTRKKIVVVKVNGAPAASGQGGAPEASRPISGNQPNLRLLPGSKAPRPLPSSCKLSPMKSM